jgi:hypothetical protein
MQNFPEIGYTTVQNVPKMEKKLCPKPIAQFVLSKRSLARVARWQDKHITWQILRDLHAQANYPWLVMGDMNEILYPFKKEGGNPRPEYLMRNFRDAINDCNLADFGYTGNKFTWHRGLIRERLDWALTNGDWNIQFGDAVLQNLEYSISDHRPILMTFDCAGVTERTGPAMLRFEAKWLKEAHFKEVVEEAWEQVGVRVQTGSLAGKLAIVHDLVHKWDKSVLQKTKRNIKNAQKEMERVVNGPLNDETLEQQRELAKEIESLLEKEEIHWSQRSRLNWFQA